MVGVFHALIAIILQLCFKFKYTKFLGAFLMIGITALCWYSTLISAITMKEEKANLWAIEYITSFGID